MYFIEMLTLVGGLCCAGFLNPIGVVATVRRQRLALFLVGQWRRIHQKVKTESRLRKFIYCILASCYVRLTLNICSFVHQCNTFTSYFLLIVDTDDKHNIRRSTWLATSHRQKLA
jgi:hypothetical protein